jgi:hypothetical protein
MSGCVPSEAFTKASPTISKELADTSCDSKPAARCYLHDIPSTKGSEREGSGSSCRDKNMSHSTFMSSEPADEELNFFPVHHLPMPLDNIDFTWTTGTTRKSNNVNHASMSSLDLFDEDFKCHEEINHVNYNLTDDCQPGLLDLQESITTIASVTSCCDNPSLEVGPAVQNESSGSLLNPTVLHQTCLLFPQNASMVRAALSCCPGSTITPSPIPLNEYTYPLHIALSKGAAFDVIQQLVVAGPAVLLQRDGPLGLTPMSLALTKDSTSVEVFQLLIQAQPHAASLACAPHYDLPLHTVCRQMATPSRLAIIEALIPANKAALFQPNGQGLTPFQLMASQPLSWANQQYKNRALTCLKYAAHMTRPLPSNAAAGISDVAGSSSSPYKRRKTCLPSFL